MSGKNEEKEWMKGKDGWSKWKEWMEGVNGISELMKWIEEVILKKLVENYIILF